MTFKVPVEDQPVEISWERSYLWGFWKSKLYAKGLYEVVQRVVEVVKGRKS